ncbi:LacI family DNA-binding transcriptional regulator [Branchiibius sp. NY16-3462-2]|uniref:LacI family DNA-binding transcriptional regulator n=1 Tax=Branchiibius sp. NY16-3462-2 TaxID=1807500 RepID=UPI000794E0EA|nr:LacI family DNA-binding transcriptional regulator [Branchiibius sp. NY16-3462-2]KYH46047.1 hypothetical protein AZH51_10375 [Branchiibius sp. NY16-3462-2]
MGTTSQNSRRVTINDVARAANVSRQTVSNVVNQPDRVAPETLEQVQVHIERLGFRPSRAARTLKQERAGAWGLQLDSHGSGRLGSILDSFLVELTWLSQDHDTHIVPFVASDHLRPMAAYQELVASRLADGFVLTNTRLDDPRPGWLVTHRQTFASFGRMWGSPGLTRWVDVDGRAGVTAATEHLQAQGFERIGFLGWPAGSPVGDDRRSGWAMAMGHTGSEDRDRWEAAAEQGFDSAAAAALPLVAAIGKGGAVACVSDAMAVGVWRAVNSLGWRPGVDFGVVGFDDTDAAQALGLTTVRQPLELVATHILQILDEPQDPDAGVLLRPDLVIRSSTMRDPADPL